MSESPLSNVEPTDADMIEDAVQRRWNRFAMLDLSADLEQKSNMPNDANIMATAFDTLSTSGVSTTRSDNFVTAASPTSDEREAPNAKRSRKEKVVPKLEAL